ncbi:DUF4249 domain-containing protein [Carboxylicivirga sp. M1479]|uniref:DUF4249 domain-containing protein n=1 Tax=Carboxylicivirga sp. M1479 TaxID=2594476 RepID=UPI0011782886|nr:DUF4249 domain-containing protein [Carboxylicivirga sp. M1479]TRX71690.1 DUF4249 domain-containing protein [Carboxylicivirga sp. M1479]
MYRKLFYALIISIALYSCLEPYKLDVSDYENLLIVDALITDEDKNHQVYLSRSISNLDEEPQKVSNALVIIRDQFNNEEVLTEIAPGIYETDSFQFKVQVGNTYVLSIRTTDGQEYESVACEILPKSSINKVHYKRGKDWSADQTQEFLGLDIMVDGGSYNGGFVRWIYDEDWKFKVPFPTKMAYDEESDDWVLIPAENVQCWKHSQSNKMVVHSFANQSNTQIKNKKVCFVPSKATDKLSVRYSILVKQLSISRNEFDFWSKLKVSSEDVGDFAGTQPFSIVGNIKNINNPKEPVLGFFQTGSVSSKRLYINRSDATDLGLPIIPYDHNCRVDSFKVDGKPYTSLMEIYEQQVLNGSYYMHDGIFDENSGRLAGFLLTSPKCADCQVTGNINKPWFWED